MRLFYAAAVCLWLCGSSFAQLLTTGAGQGDAGGGTTSPSSSSCPYGSGLGDGCSGALSTATQQTSGLFASFPQNGQTYQTASFTGSVNGATLTVSGVTGTINPNGHLDTLQGSAIPAGTTIIAGGGSTWTLSANLGIIGSRAMTTQFRPPWNVAGIEYPVGAPPANTLTDPSTLSTCSGTSIPICLMSGHTNIVELASANSGADMIVDHYDFSLHGGYNVLLNFAISGNLTVSNSKFAAGSAFQSGGDVYSFYGGCGSVMFDANSRSDTVAGTASFINDEFDGKADTGSATINCPGSGAVFNVWPTSPSNSVIVEYGYFHDYNPRIQFGYGATIKYTLFSNNNYNTANHGELTAFNESCGALSGCPGVSTIDLEYDLVTQGNAYCGGQTAPIFLGSGLISAQTTDVTAKNNVFLNNGCGMTSVSVSSPAQTGCTGTSADGANCQITFTTVDGVAGSNTFTLRDGDICTTAGTASGYISCPALLQAQLSGTTGGSGTYRYSSGNALGSATSMWLAVSSSPSIFMTGENYRNIDSENNYIDGTGAGNFADEPQSIGDCGINTTSAIRYPASGTITSANNWWMTGTLFNGGPNESYGKFSFSPCLKFAEGVLIPGSISGTTLSATGAVTFNASISGQTLTVNSGSAPAAGDTITDGGVNIPLGLQVTCFPDCGPTNFTVSNSLTVSSETMYAGSFYGAVNGHAFFDTAAGARTDTLFGSGITPGSVTFSSCTPTQCTLSSSPGTLSGNFSALVP